MPIYEYECSKCGHQTEVWQKITDRAAVRCELCKGKMKKLISQSAFHLKGTGWYVTDYASKRGGSVPSASGGDKETSTGKVKEAPEKSKKEASPVSDKD